MQPLLFGLSAQYPALQPALNRVLYSQTFNALEILLPEGDFSDPLPVRRFLCTLSASGKYAVLTFQTRKKRSGFFSDSSRQIAFFRQIRSLLDEIRNLDGIAGFDFDFSSEPDPKKNHPFWDRILSLFEGGQSPNLSFFERKPWFSRFFSEPDPLFSLDVLRKLRFGRFFLRDLPAGFPVPLAFLSGAGGVFFSSQSSVPEISDLSKVLGLLSLGRRQCRAAVLFSENPDYLSFVKLLHQTLCGMGVRPDMIRNSDFVCNKVRGYSTGISDCTIGPGFYDENYSLIFTPFLSVIPEYLVSRLFSFAEKGGVWVCGPCAATSVWESVLRPAGVYRKKEFSGLSAVSALWEDGTVFSGFFPVEGYYPGGEDWVLQESLSLMKCCRVGRGTVVFLGAFPTGDSLEKCVFRALRLAGLPFLPPEPGVYSAEFSGAYPNGDPLCFTAAYSSGGGSLPLSGAYIDLLSGHAAVGSRFLEPDRLYLFKKLRPFGARD